MKQYMCHGMERPDYATNAQNNNDADRSAPLRRPIIVILFTQW